MGVEPHVSCSSWSPLPGYVRDLLPEQWSVENLPLQGRLLVAPGAISSSFEVSTLDDPDTASSSSSVSSDSTSSDESSASVPEDAHLPPAQRATVPQTDGNSVYLASVSRDKVHVGIRRGQSDWIPACGCRRVKDLIEMEEWQCVSYSRCMRRACKSRF